MLVFFFEKQNTTSSMMIKEPDTIENLTGVKVTKAREHTLIKHAKISIEKNRLMAKYPSISH